MVFLKLTLVLWIKA